MKYIKTLLLSIIVLVFIPSSVGAQSNIFQELQTPFYDPNSATVGDQCTDSSLSGNDNETKTWNYFKGKGLSDPQVAGIMGNMMQESHFNPVVMEKGGESQNPADADPKGWGIIQWTPGSEVPGMVDAAGLSGHVYELATQLDLVWGHMQNKPPITKGDFSLTDFKQINDEKLATQYFLFHIEAGTDPINPKTGQPVREEFATQILKDFGGTSSDGATGATSETCGQVITTDGNCSAKKIVFAAQYSQAQLTQMFGDPGTADSHSAMAANLTDIDFLGRSVQVNKLAAPCLQAVADDWKANNISYKLNSIGCYRFDSDNGSSNIGLRSYHTYGIACDINPSTNNFYSNGSPRPFDPNCPSTSEVVDSGHCYDMPRAVINIFAAHGFSWGGNFNSVKDYMHFEWHGLVPQ
jgi:hypothetical protein